ncbi:hypothetical protein EDC94DRAFT_582133 [Helicostylum pulchrum]|nr:hypothetical protein EDC94DRAFT_582133 [Helicostylum pulchrum]
MSQSYSFIFLFIIVCPNTWASKKELLDYVERLILLKKKKNSFGASGPSFSWTQKKFFCPEKHGIIRFGENFSAGPPTMPKDLYQSLVSNNVFKSGVMNSSRSSDLIVIDQAVQKM